MRGDKLDVMAYMHFVTAAGKSFTLNSRQYRNIAWALHDGQIAEGRLLSAEKETPYHRYRVKRLGSSTSSVSTGPTDYVITTCRSSQKDMDRMERSSFARLDSVILALSKLPTPRGCLQLMLAPVQNDSSFADDVVGGLGRGDAGGGTPSEGAWGSAPSWRGRGMDSTKVSTIPLWKVARPGAILSIRHCSCSCRWRVQRARRGVRRH